MTCPKNVRHISQEIAFLVAFLATPARDGSRALGISRKAAMRRNPSEEEVACGVQSDDEGD
jgi:hypothetical protein